ncbi:MFS transporter SIT family siderophore-iron:H+ symporter [Microdochium nivale]|nr:MFS transporter SIT family siderophore-iron:H+ symporter [Microdochium nivale]
MASHGVVSGKPAGAGGPGDANANADGLERRSSSDTEVSGQDGVKAIEAISMTWTKWGLIAAYFSIFLMAFTTSLEGQVTYSVVAFATSSFGEHSLISTVYTIQGVVNAVIKPPMAKVADVFGRLEAFSLCILLYTLGYVQMAASNNIETFASAQIFYSAGSQGLATLQQIFIADTSDMPNRALFSSLPDTPFLVTIWIGPLIGTAIRLSSTWRWAYGMWAIILPVTFLPLALTLFLNSRRAKKTGALAPRHNSKFSLGAVLRTIWVDLDLLGMILLSAAFGMILVPLTIVAVTPGGWQSPMIIGLIVGGFVALVLFLLWESWARFVPYPLIPLGLLKSRTFSAGCGIGFFYFMAFYLSVQPYFNSYLLVVQNMDAITAGYITQTFSFTSTVASIIISLVIKYTKHYKYYVVAGSLIYLLGMGLMIRYRTAGASVGTLVGTQIVIGIGGGMLNVPAQLGVQASCSHQQVGVATAVFLTLVSIGGAVGSAISGAVWGQLLPRKLEAYLSPLGLADQATAIYGNVNIASGVTGTYTAGTPARDAINAAYDETMNTLLTIAACVCVPIVLLALLMRNYNLDEMNQGVKGRVIGGEVTAGEKKVGHEGAVGVVGSGGNGGGGGGGDGGPDGTKAGRGPRSWFRRRA